MSENSVLKDLLLDSKDGEWGKSESFENSVEMKVIRGADFENVRSGDLSSVPIRHVARRHAIRKKLQPHDIIIETAGGGKNRPTGRTLFLSESKFQNASLPLICASFARFIRINPKKANSNYIFWLLQHLYRTEVLRKYHTQHTGVARFQWTVFSKNEMLQLPPLKIQDKISSILSDFDDSIEVNFRRIKILEEIAQTVYNEWFVHFRYPGYENEEIMETPHGPKPKGWKILKAKDFGKVITGKTPSKRNPENFGDFMPFIKTPDMHGSIFCIKTSEMLSKIGAESQRKTTLPPNSLCTSCIGTAGIVSITSVQSQTNQQINSVILNIIAEREFLYFVLKKLKPTIELYGAAGATMTNLSKGKFMNLEILHPGKELVSKYSEIVAPMFDEIQILQKKNEVLKQTRDQLLPKLISGEIDVSQLNLYIR